MKVAIPREVKNNEFQVAITSSGDGHLTYGPVAQAHGLTLDEVLG